MIHSPIRERQGLADGQNMIQAQQNIEQNAPLLGAGNNELPPGGLRPCGARTDDNDRTHDVEAVSKCTLPSYWSFNPRLWFAQAESAFLSSRITNDRSRYNLLVAHLPPDVAQEVSDIILAPPAEQRYDTLKAAVLSRLAASADQQLHQLLNEVQLGDRTFSQLLRYMRRLARTAITDEALRVKCLDLLPAQASRMCRVLKATLLEELADEIVAPCVPVSAVSRPSSPTSSGIASGSSTPLPQHEMTSLRLAMTQITTILQQQSLVLQSIASILTSSQQQQQQQRQQERRGRSRMPASQRQARTASPAPRAANPAWCWYHQRFASEATQCRPPCSYPTQEN
ncbi:uncharacterized protein LOC116738671 [Nasonia vitripennis]|uniref:DUF7041 domain-containing protein n=1 Tax=Nasonia vitripennis TaxID=7425 RepID=A0A7M7R5A8_NASVI|nr:uncharacterized protein LOC116738671 [Nasonia vitripennis]